jgi:ATP-dependent Clp protease ATP-binding subunit ClpA
LAARILKEEIELKLSGELVSFVAQRGFDPNFGARPLRRVISELVEDPLSEEILAGKFHRGDKITPKISKGKISFDKLA